MKLSIVEVFAQETSTQANSFTVFLSLKCMYELLKFQEEPKNKSVFCQNSVFPHHLFMRAFFNINCLKNPLPTDVGQEVLFLKDSNNKNNPKPENIKKNAGNFVNI